MAGRSFGGCVRVKARATGRTVEIIHEAGIKAVWGLPVLWQGGKLSCVRGTRDYNGVVKRHTGTWIGEKGCGFMFMMLGRVPGALGCV
jgi:hypothetical protein